MGIEAELGVNILVFSFERQFQVLEWEVLEIDGKMIDGLLGLYAWSYGSLQKFSAA